MFFCLSLWLDEKQHQRVYYHIKKTIEKYSTGFRAIREFRFWSLVQLLMALKLVDELMSCRWTSSDLIGLRKLHIGRRWTFLAEELQDVEWNTRHSCDRRHLAKEVCGPNEFPVCWMKFRISMRMSKIHELTYRSIVGRRREKWDTAPSWRALLWPSACEHLND